MTDIKLLSLIIPVGAVVPGEVFSRAEAGVPLEVFFPVVVIVLPEAFVLPQRSFRWNCRESLGPARQMD